MLKNKLLVFVGVLYLGFVAWWVSFQHLLTKQGLSIKWFSGTYVIFSLIGAIVSLIASFKWGGWKTVLGRALLFYALGLLGQTFGQLLFTYFVYSDHIQSPYPALDDIGYSVSTLSYLIGGIFLSQFVGAKYALKKFGYKVLVVLVPIVILGISYWFFIHGQPVVVAGKHMTTYLNIEYPVGDALYISFSLIAFLVSRKLLGGKFQLSVLLLVIAMCIQYSADFTFLYMSSRGTYITGCIDDFLYFTSYFFTTVAMISFLSLYKKLKNREVVPDTTGVNQADRSVQANG